MQAAHKQASAYQSLLPVARGIGTFFIAGLGLMLGAVLGSLVVPIPAGVGAVFGGLIAGGVFLLIGCCATGFWHDFMPDPGSFDASSVLPNALTPLVAEHCAFTLIVTIHKIDNIRVSNRMPWASPNLFVEIECGDNPLKRTCVKADGTFQFDEQFRVAVKPSDAFVNIYVKDQLWFSSRYVGVLSVDIRRHIINDSFPGNKHFVLEGGEEYTLAHMGGVEDPTVSLSFGHTGDFMDPYSLGSQTNTKARITRKPGDDENTWQSDYGSISYLSNLQFNQDVRVDFDAVSGMHPQPKKPEVQPGGILPSIWAKPDENSAYVNV